MAGDTKTGHCNVCGIVKKATVKLHLCEKRRYESAVARNHIVKTKSASVFRRTKHARAYANVCVNQEIEEEENSSSEEEEEAENLQEIYIDSDMDFEDGNIFEKMISDL